MAEEDRPVHVEINVSTGAITHTPITDEEWDAMRLAEAEAVRAEEQSAESDRVLREAVAVHPDPVVQALAQRVGLA